MTAEHPLGTLHFVDDKPILRFERVLAHPPEKVWRAITEPAEMRHWFPAVVRSELRAGAEMQFSFGEDGVDLGSPYAHGEILEYDPPKVYAFRWYDSVLRFELLPDDAGCRLVFSHMLSNAGTWGDLPSTARQGAGWDACLSILAASLAGESTPRPEFLRRAEQYVAEFGLGEGIVVADGAGYVVRFERDLIQPAADVWATLTEGHDVSRVPARFTHPHVVPGRVGVLEPPRVLEYGWLDAAGRDSGRVRFELGHQEPIGTRLVVTQTIPGRLAQSGAVVSAAWQVHLELLFATLFGDVRSPWPAGRVEQLTRLYAARLA
jgi:uncharacterized protein YndB with AHSA1/START domain